MTNVKASKKLIGTALFALLVCVFTAITLFATPSAQTAHAASESYWWPTKTGSISSKYGTRTIKGVTGFHNGIDISVSVGTAVYASKSGTVIDVNNSCSHSGVYGDGCGGGFGNRIYIKHSDGSVTRYAHLKKDSLLVKNGAAVKQGQQISQSGNSGSSTGPHLHFEIVNSSGTRVNPEPLLTSRPTGTVSYPITNITATNYKISAASLKKRTVPDPNNGFNGNYMTKGATVSVSKLCTYGGYQWGYYTAGACWFAIKETKSGGAVYATVAPKAQSALTVTSVASKTFGDAAFNLSTSGGSGSGAVTYKLVSGPATVTSAGKVTITGAGTIVVNATKAADSTYSAITSANRSITVNKAAGNGTISINGWTYNGTAANPTLGNTSTAGTPTVNYKVNGAADSTYSSVKPSNAGNYTVRAQFPGTANYAANTAVANFTIAKATYNLSGIKFENRTATHDGKTQTITISGDLPAGVTVSYSGGSANIGTHTITAKFTGDFTNYNAIPNMTATLTIKEAATPETPSPDLNESTAAEIERLENQLAAMQETLDALVNRYAILESDLANLWGLIELFFSEDPAQTSTNAIAYFTSVYDEILATTPPDLGVGNSETTLDNAPLSLAAIIGIGIASAGILGITVALLAVRRKRQIR